MKNLLEVARQKYENSGYEWAYGGWGGDKDGNGILDIDCSHLVSDALKEAGYHLPYLPTSTLHSEEARKYFEVVPTEEASAEADDLILYGGHVGIFISYDTEGKTGTFFGSQSKGPNIARFTEGKTTKSKWGTDFVILRPKKHLKAVSAPNSSKRETKRWSAGGHDVSPRRWRDEQELGPRRWVREEIIDI